MPQEWDNLPPEGGGGSMLASPTDDSSALAAPEVRGGLPGPPGAGQLRGGGCRPVVRGIRARAPSATTLHHTSRSCATATQSRETPMAWALLSRLKPTAQSFRANS
eukprot:CAMPEP_0185179210 /NCGR_PEP_ID=MMETSP1139-20130426/31897_1 /TAXON_ID=298111 /ORGANISM="Pavlova sp., Strain CCMP459" /LENGTH=105 /DNA_ID=CAMNT_0027745045 /DNA_START=195 /DNA_END=513 /DNA_ORIENTATION=+